MEKTTNRKPTQRQMFTELLENPTLTEEQKQFIKGRIEALDKKNASASNGEKKLTERQIANEAIKQAIVEAMETGKTYTVSEVIKTVPACAGLYTQRVSPMLNALVDAGVLVKTEVKGRSYFGLPDAPEVEG